ncbi:MAG TPA: transcription antitermination factor NusB [bacterium (Candidatus Stahlbacteria)]|nr:transcription antitermination factor NusB [Candidatus Stahlbacteria bacterium]
MRHQARRIALEALYRFSNNGEDPAIALKDIISRDQLPEEAIVYARKIVNGVQKSTARIDDLISRNLNNWHIDRLSMIDQTILRIGVFEILMQEIPYQVALDEAIRLAKEYGGSESYSFINGVLDSIRKEICGSE